MNCVMCGREIPDTTKFCPYCGAKTEQQQEPAGGQSAEIPVEKTQNGTRNVLQIGLFILAGECGVLAFRDFLSVIQNFGYGSAMAGMGFFLEMACMTGMAVILVMLGISKEKEKQKTLFLVLSGLAIFMAAYGIIQFISSLIRSVTGYYFSFYNFIWFLSTLLLTVVAMAAVVGVTYGLLQAGGQTPDLSNILKSKSASGYRGQAAGTNYNNQTAGTNYNNQTAGTNYNNQNAGANYSVQGGGMNYGGQNTGANYNNQGNGMNYQGQGITPLKTDRGLLGYILLSIITCGIYSYYFIYTIARDVNTACAGDGKSTSGLLKYILLSMITCGIYSWWWEYSLGNRLAENAPRYGMSFTENGTTILMWILFGVLLCGIGPFIAMNIIIKNTNSICMAYNRYNGLM